MLYGERKFTDALYEKIKDFDVDLKAKEKLKNKKERNNKKETFLDNNKRQEKIMKYEKSKGVNAITAE